MMGTSDWEEEVANTNRYYSDRKNYLDMKYEEFRKSKYNKMLMFVGNSSTDEAQFAALFNDEDKELFYTTSSSERLTLDLIMTDTENNPGELSGIKEVFVDSLYDENTDFGTYYTTFNDLVVEAGIDEEIHYFRNTINEGVVPETLEELYAINAKLYEKYGSEEHGWKLLGHGTSMYHMNGPGGEFNVKLVLGFGEHFEAVYDSNGNLVTENSGEYGAINMGTYNFFGPSQTDKHKNFDAVPYFKWGNTSDTSPTLGGLTYNVEGAWNVVYDLSPEAIKNWEEVFKKSTPKMYEEYDEKRLEEILEGYDSL